LFSIIKAVKGLGCRYHCGRVRSHDSFYTDEEDNIDKFWSNRGILGADMETSPLFVVGGLRGLRTGSILNVVVEYSKDLEEGINEYVSGEEEAFDGEKREILTALEAIVNLEAMKQEK
jgi:uridine phosphorylase